MLVDEPAWWYEAPHDARIRLLKPLARLWAHIAESRFKNRVPYRSRFPVVCVGNFTAGGTGKTPLSMYLAVHLARQGERPVILTRGYGGRIAGPHWVNPATDPAPLVGDEALLLAQAAPVLVARDRRKGMLAIENGTRPVNVVIMDDGLQNPALVKDLTIAIVDGERGIGNGEVIPAGPLRARLEFQLGLTGVIVVNGPPGITSREAGENAAEALVHERLRRVFPGPVLAAETIPSGETSWLRGAPIVAYSGIGHPQRFYNLLQARGAELAAIRTFPDHHPFREREAEELLALAKKHRAMLVTTEKDWMRLRSSVGACAELFSLSRSLPVRLVFAERDEERLAALTSAVVLAGGYRQGMALSTSSQGTD